VKNVVFKALADPTRRRILELLKSGPKGSGEIAEAFPSSWPTISRHLSLLRDAGLIQATREGQHIRYELDTSVVQDLVQHLLGWIGKGKGGGHRVP
jgi:DNA-binding transcriptional ArsR family regulator